MRVRCLLAMDRQIGQQQRRTERLRLLDGRRPSLEERRINHPLASGVEAQDMIVGDQTEVTEMALDASRVSLGHKSIVMTGIASVLGEARKDYGWDFIKATLAFQARERFDH